MKDKIFIALQYIAPQHLLSRLIGLLAESKNPTIKNFLIHNFIKIFNVDMQQASIENPQQYHSFNHFFTRELKSDLRPIPKKRTDICCPADGTVSQIGNIRHNQLLQAKNHEFRLSELLATTDENCSQFNDGSFATIYLSPKDYHRIHMPIDGTLLSMRYIPGKLFSVNQTTADNVPNLFSRNERVACHFQTKAGEMVVIFVGAMIVAGINTQWAGQITPVGKNIIETNYQKQKFSFKKGEQLGYFNLGSTVIVLFEKDKALFNQHLYAGSTVIMGGKLGELIPEEKM